MSSAEMIVVRSKEDVILVMNPCCNVCMEVKLPVIKVVGTVVSHEIVELSKCYGVKLVRIKCECSR